MSTWNQQKCLVCFPNTRCQSRTLKKSRVSKRPLYSAQNNTSETLFDRIFRYFSDNFHSTSSKIFRVSTTKEVQQQNLKIYSLTLWLCIMTFSYNYEIFHFHFFLQFSNLLSWTRGILERRRNYERFNAQIKRCNVWFSASKSFNWNVVKL